MAAQLDSGKLDAILGALGRIEGALIMQTAPPVFEEPAAPLVVIGGDETITSELADIAEPVAELIDDGIEEVEGIGVEVEDAIAAPIGRKKKRGLMRRSRGRG